MIVRENGIYIFFGLYAKTHHLLAMKDIVCLNKQD